MVIVIMLMMLEKFFISSRFRTRFPDPSLCDVIFDLAEIISSLATYQGKSAQWIAYELMNLNQVSEKTKTEISFAVLSQLFS